MQVRKQEQYVNFMKLQDQLIKAQSRSRDRKNKAQSSAFSGASKFSRQSKKSDQKISINIHDKQTIKREKGRQQTMNQPPSLNLTQGAAQKMGNITSELNQNFKSIKADQEQQKRILSQDAYKSPNITAAGYHGTRKIRSRNRNLAMDHQSLPQQQQLADLNVINQVMQMQAKMNMHQHSHDNLKIEDQDQLHATMMSKRQARSRNAAIRQSLSQNTAPVAAAAPENITDGSQAARPQGPVGMQNQYQQMLLGDQSLAQLTQLTLNSMGPSVQDDQSIQRLNEHLQDLSSNNTNSNSKIGPENLDNFSASQPKMPKKLMPQNFFGVGATPAPYNGSLVAPYENQKSQLDLRNLNMVMNLNKGRNTRIHGTHQQTTQVPMKNIGGTDNPSSVDDTSNLNSSSVLTIGLPSVMSQGGGAAMLHVRNTGPQSNINLNMNMNFNIQNNPLQIEDQSELSAAAAQKLITQIKQSTQLKQHSSQHKRHLQRNQNKAMKQSDNIPKSDHLGSLSIHDNSKIQQLLSVQRSNQNSLKSLQKVASVQKKPEQMKNIYNNLQNLSFNDQSRMAGQFVHHHKSLTKATNLSNYQSQGANQRRLIPLKKNANQSMAIPKNYLTAEQSESQQQTLLSKKNFRVQNAQNRQSNNNNARSKTIPVKLSNHEAIQPSDLPVSSSHANSAENLRQTVAKAPQFQEQQNGANITIENQQLQEQSSELNISSNDPSSAQQNLQRQVNKEERGRQLSHISTALQYFRQSQKTNPAKDKILSMPSQQLSQILLKKIPIQQQKELLEEKTKTKSGQLMKNNDRKQLQQHGQKNFQTDFSNSFQSSSKLSHQNESGASKRKELQLHHQGSQRSAASSQNASGVNQNASNISNGEFGSDQSKSHGASDGTTNPKKIQKQFESTNPYDLRIEANKQRNSSNDGLNKSRSNNFQSKKLIQMIQDQRAVTGQVMQRIAQGEENEKQSDKNGKQIKNQFTLTNQNEQDAQAQLAQTQDAQLKYQQTKNSEFDQSVQGKSGSKYPSSSPLASPELQPVSGTGSQQILKMQEQSSAVKVRRGRDITNTVAPGIINFGFDSNSFEDESSSHYPERLEALESQQFDTQLDFQYKQMLSNRRFDCENTELDLEPVRLGQHQQMNFEKKAAETQQVAKPYQYNLPSERSQNMFEQKSIRNDFEASQGFTSSEQGAPDGMDQDNDPGSARMANANHREVLTGGINQYDERDQMQTAIVLQSGSASSRESSSQMQAEDTDRSCYIRRQTPAFKEKRRQKLEEQDNRRQEMDSRDENSGAEREELHTLVVRQTLPSRWSQQEAQSRRSRQSKEIPEDESTQNFARQFGITQTLERKSRRLSDNSEEFTDSLPTEQYQPGQNKAEIPGSYNEEHLQQCLNTNQKQKLSRNSRFKNQSKTIAASGAFEPRPYNEHKSLEQRLREEELLDGNELITIYRNGRGRPAGPRNRSRGDGRNPLLDSNQTIVSKQRVRQVPVSNAPKRLRNISTAKKNHRSSRHSESDKGDRSEKNLSMKQDSTKKNVYHIFGRQTSDSFVSIKQKSFDGRPEPATSAQATTGGGPTLKEGQEAGKAISDSQKKQRKLLFALSQKQQSSLNHNFDENCRSDMRAKQRMHMQQSVQSFGKQQKRIPITSLIEKPRVSDYSGNQKIEGAEDQYRTVDALPRRRLYQQQQMDKPQRFFHCSEEYGSNPGGDHGKFWPPSDQVNQGESQASGIDSEEECYGENWYSVGQPGPLQEYQEPKRQYEKQNRQRSAQSLQHKKRGTNKSLKARGHKPSKNYQAVLEMREINQGVVYDKQGRGRRTLGDGGPDGERLIFYNQSRTLTPRKEQEDPYHEGHHGVRIHHQLQFSTRQQDQHYSSLTREMPEHMSRERQIQRGSAHQGIKKQIINNRDGQRLRKSQNTEGDPPRRIKKPKDIYALHLEKPAECAEDSEDQLQLISYNPPEQQRQDHTTSQGLERYNFVDYEGYDELEPESYIEVHQKSSANQNEDPSYHRVFNFLTIPYQSRNTNLVPGGQHTSSLVRHNESLFEISNQGGTNGQQPSNHTRNWRQHGNHNGAIMHKRLQAKSKESFTRNRLNREANASGEMVCQENMVILGSPKPSAGRGGPQKDVGGSDQVSGMRKLQRGRLRQAVGGGAKLRRVAMSQDPAIRSKSNYSLEGNIDEAGKKGNAQNLAAWCCLHSKSRAASCESGTAVKADHSDNASSVCSVF